MGIVSFCPVGHRVKVKAHLAGKKGVCPTCGATFRIPRATATPSLSAAARKRLPTAVVVSLDPDVAARLPLAGPLEPAPADAPSEADRMADIAAGESDIATAAGPLAVIRHPAIAAAPGLAWCLAVPGGTASEPMDAAALQAWLDARKAAGNELVWRSDWADWKPISGVFPEYLP